MTTGHPEDRITVRMRTVTEWEITIPMPLATALTPEQIEGNGHVLAEMAIDARDSRRTGSPSPLQGQVYTEYVSAEARPAVEIVEQAEGSCSA